MLRSEHGEHTSSCFHECFVRHGSLVDAHGKLRRVDADGCGVRHHAYVRFVRVKSRRAVAVANCWDNVRAECEDGRGEVREYVFGRRTT